MTIIHAPPVRSCFCSILSRRLVHNARACYCLARMSDSMDTPGLRLNERYRLHMMKAEQLEWQAAARQTMRKHPHIVLDSWSHACKLAGEGHKQEHSGPLAYMASSTGSATTTEAITDGPKPSPSPEASPVSSPRSASSLQAAPAKPSQNDKQVHTLTERFSGPIDRHRATICALCLNDLTAVLPCIDNAKFNPWAQRGLAPPGAKHASNYTCLHVIEFLTALGEHFHIDVSMHTSRTSSNFVGSSLSTATVPRCPCPCH